MASASSAVSSLLLGCATTTPAAYSGVVPMAAGAGTQDLLDPNPAHPSGPPPPPLEFARPQPSAPPAGPPPATSALLRSRLLPGGFRGST
eukprot:5547706-Prymnesium_polylepis.1